MLADMAEDEVTPEQLAAIAAENEEPEPVNYKPPAQKSVKEIHDLDKDRVLEHTVFFSNTCFLNLCLLALTLHAASLVLSCLGFLFCQLHCGFILIGVLYVFTS